MTKPQIEFQVHECGGWATIHSTLPMDNGAVEAFGRVEGIQVAIGSRYSAMVYKGKLFSWDDVRANVMEKAVEMRYCQPSEVQP